LRSRHPITRLMFGLVSESIFSGSFDALRSLEGLFEEAFND
jgi:hypothetical protein